MWKEGASRKWLLEEGSRESASLVQYHQKNDKEANETSAVDRLGMKKRALRVPSKGGSQSEVEGTTRYIKSKNGETAKLILTIILY